jgi:Glyoxalase/Bleomycin resistance protein/Dioxygenase superfamily
MGRVRAISPILPVQDLRRSMRHYEQLGFAVRTYNSGEYGFAVRDGIEIHLGVTADPAATSSAYLFVDDVDELAASWRTVGVTVRGPEDAEWGKREGAVVDHDGNVLRFGSPL